MAGVREPRTLSHIPNGYAVELEQNLDVTAFKRDDEK
jgi:hypothetical protein